MNGATMDKTQALQNLLNGAASEEDVELLKRLLASGEISIGGNVNRSVVIIGSGNTVELTPEALSLLNLAPSDEDMAAAEGEPPYMGLRYFDTADAELFYGREVLTQELAARVASENFLAIVGASGSGKSSVVRAGLIPALKRGGTLADGTRLSEGSDPRRNAKGGSIGIHPCPIRLSFDPTLVSVFIDLFKDRVLPGIKM